MRKRSGDPMELSFAERVYEEMNGFYAETVVPGVRDESTRFGFIGRCVDKLYDARERLRARYHIPQEDPDVEDMMNAVEEMCRACSVQMFHYGAQFGEREN